MTLEEAEDDFNYWNDLWLKGCYDPAIERDLWEAKQGEVIYGEEKSRSKKFATNKGTI